MVTNGLRETKVIGTRTPIIGLIVVVGVGVRTEVYLPLF